MKGSEKCRDCCYYSPCDVPKEATAYDYPTQRKDGWCSKVFPRGYLGAGKPGGYVFSGKSHCFQFEQKESEQVSLLDSMRCSVPESGGKT